MFPIFVKTPRFSVNPECIQIKEETFNCIYNYVCTKRDLKYQTQKPASILDDLNVRLVSIAF